MEQILIVDDEREIADVVELYLQNEYKVLKFYTGKEALECIDSTRIDLAILDVMLPDIDGFTILKKIREKYTFPVLMLTAKTEYLDKITGLTMGADDYIPKPFRPRELLMRIKNVLRRTSSGGGLVRLGPVEVDTVRGRATKDGQDLNLSALEYRLLLMFLNHPGAVLTRSQLLEGIWDIAGDFVNDNTLTVYIKRLREKIEDDPQAPALIKTVRGMGYKAEMG